MTEPVRKYDIPKQVRAVLCKGCRAWIAFVKTEDGKNMPVEAMGDARGEPHWIRCPQSKEFKGKGQTDLFGDAGRKA